MTDYDIGKVITKVCHHSFFDDNGNERIDKAYCYPQTFILHDIKYDFEDSVCDNCQKRGCRTFCFRCNKRFYCNKKCKEEHGTPKEKCDDDIERTVRITKMSIS